MPISYDIDRALRLVITTPKGVLTDEEIFSYQQEVWSRPENGGYDELIDMAGVTEIDFISVERVSELANLSSSMDTPSSPSKLAIVATAELHYGLGRMYQTHREMSRQSTKVVRLFRTREEALKWLGVSGEL